MHEVPQNASLPTVFNENYEQTEKKADSTASQQLAELVRAQAVVAEGMETLPLPGVNVEVITPRPAPAPPTGTVPVCLESECTVISSSSRSSSSSSSSEGPTVEGIASIVAEEIAAVRLRLQESLTTRDHD